MTRKNEHETLAFLEHCIINLMKTHVSDYRLHLYSGANNVFLIELELKSDYSTRGIIPNLLRENLSVPFILKILP